MTKKKFSGSIALVFSLIFGVGALVVVKAKAKIGASEVSDDPTQATTVVPSPEGDAGDAKPVLGEWFALGSGCRARDTIPGDVVREDLPLSASEGLRYGTRFRLDQFHLDTRDQDATDSESFARECAIRLAVNPPRGTRVASVSARTTIVSNKSEGPKLMLFGELKIGPASLGRSLSLFESDVNHVGKVLDLYLAPNAEGGQPVPPLICGIGKIIAFDYTWAVSHFSASQTADVRLGGNKALDVIVDLEECQEEDAGPPSGPPDVTVSGPDNADLGLR